MINLLIYLYFYACLIDAILLRSIPADVFSVFVNYDLGAIP
jgi:hypothetical protein